MVFVEGVYPSCLKLTKILPIFKSGSKTVPGNYRPISFLSSIKKSIEKAMYSCLFSFLVNLINLIAPSFISEKDILLL